MRSLLADILSGTATVALITTATRWLSNTKGNEFPETHGVTSIYSIGRPWRVVGIASATFAALLSAWVSYDLRSRPDGGTITISVLFVAMGLWLASGLVITDQAGITKKVFWYSRTLPWSEITEIRLLRKRGETAIELRSGPRKMVIDFRFNAFQYLLRENGRSDPSKDDQFLLRSSATLGVGQSQKILRHTVTSVPHRPLTKMCINIQKILASVKNSRNLTTAN
jgi:hypothetical protein